MADPTYELDKIKADKVWHTAYVLSEHLNDNAPIGWFDYIDTARAIKNGWKEFTEIMDG